MRLIGTCSFRGLSSDSWVCFLFVVVTNKPVDSFPKSCTVFSRKWINIILFHRSPKPLGIDVVRKSDTSSHAAPYFKFSEPLYPCGLVNWIPLSEFIISGTPCCFINHIISMQAFMKGPANNKTTVHIYNCR